MQQDHKLQDQVHLFFQDQERLAIFENLLLKLCILDISPLKFSLKI